MSTHRLRVLSRRVLLGAWASSLVPSFVRNARAHKKKKTVKPLSAEHRKILRDIPRDSPPKNLIQDQHFFVSDESQPERFRVALRDLGGVYIGVGPEQNYLYAGWSKPDILILLDFDQMVVDIHALYRIFIRQAPSADALIKLWHKDEKSAAVAAIKKATTNINERNTLLRVYRGARRPIYHRLRSLRMRYVAMDIASFLTEQAQYDYIRSLFEAGRVRAVRGDLTKDKAMNGVAKAAKKLGVPVRCIYLSNVEQYFDYDSGIGANCKAQPTDGVSKVLRTLFRANSKVASYHYCEQRDTYFRAWLATDVKNIRELMARAYKRIQKTKHAWILPGPT